MAKSVDMTEGKPLKLLIQFAFPLVIGNLFQQAYTLVDRIIVGQFVGPEAFSAVGATTALSNLFMSVCMGMSIGSCDNGNCFNICRAFINNFEYARKLNERCC